jgi:hypothetical protein
VVNALATVKEFKDEGDEVQLIFDGAGVRWVGELTQDDHKAGLLFHAVRDKIVGACGFCAAAFGVKESLKQHGVPLLSENYGHPSFKQLVTDGYEIITF